MKVSGADPHARRLLYGPRIHRPRRQDGPAGWIASSQLLELSGAHFRRPVKAALYPHRAGVLFFLLDEEARLFRFARTGRGKEPERFEIPFPGDFNPQGPVFLSSSGESAWRLYWRSTDRSTWSAQIKRGALSARREISPPGRAAAPTDSRHGHQAAWFELGGDSQLSSGLYISRKVGRGEPLRTCLCPASPKAAGIRSFQDPDGCSLVAWVEPRPDGLWQINAWSSKEGEATVLALAEERIEILDLRSRQGLPCLLWKEEGNKGVFLSDPTTPEGGLLLPDEAGPGAFLAGRSDLAYLAGRAEKGVRVTSVHFSGAGRALHIKNYPVLGIPGPELALSEGEEGDIRLFFSEYSGGQYLIRTVRIHDLADQTEVVYRSSPGCRLKIVEALHRPGDPAAVLFSEFDPDENKASMRVAFDPDSG